MSIVEWRFAVPGRCRGFTRWSCRTTLGTSISVEKWRDAFSLHRAQHDVDLSFGGRIIFEEDLEGLLGLLAGDAPFDSRPRPTSGRHLRFALLEKFLAAID